MTTMHMSVGLDFTEELVREYEREGRPQTFLIDRELGTPLSYVAALTHINLLRSAGLEVIPACNETDHTGRCTGHS